MNLIDSKNQVKYMGVLTKGIKEYSYVLQKDKHFTYPLYFPIPYKFAVVCYKYDLLSCELLC